MTTVLVIDNYDSFAYNLVQYVGSAVGAPDDGDIIVRRNDAVTVDDIQEMDPDGIVISPGPGTPSQAGVSIPVFRYLGYPTLGVCLGHQALCAAYGGRVSHAPHVVHGKPSTVRHDGQGVFTGLPDTIEVGRYHSLAVTRRDLPSCLVETAYVDDGRMPGTSGAADSANRSEPFGPSGQSAPRRSRTDDGERGVVMGVRHRKRPHVGVQFHPESILTDTGMAMIENFCRQCQNDDRKRISR